MKDIAIIILTITNLYFIYQSNKNELLHKHLLITNKYLITKITKLKEQNKNLKELLQLKSQIKEV